MERTKFKENGGKNCRMNVLSEFENSVYSLIKSKVKGITLSALKNTIFTKIHRSKNGNSGLKVEGKSDKKFKEILMKLIGMNLVIKIRTNSKHSAIKYYSIDKIFGSKKLEYNENSKTYDSDLITLSNIEVNIENFTFLKGSLLDISNRIQKNEVLNEEIFTFDYEFISILKDIIFRFVHHNNSQKVQNVTLKNTSSIDAYCKKNFFAPYSSIEHSTNVEEILSFLNKQKISKIDLGYFDVHKLCELLVYEDRLVEYQTRKYQLANNNCIESLMYVNENSKTEAINSYFCERKFTKYEKFTIFDLFNDKNNN